MYLSTKIMINYDRIFDSNIILLNFKIHLIICIGQAVSILKLYYVPIFLSIRNNPYNVHKRYGMLHKSFIYTDEYIESLDQ